MAPTYRLNRPPSPSEFSDDDVGIPKNPSLPQVAKKTPSLTQSAKKTPPLTQSAEKTTAPPQLAAKPQAPPTLPKSKPLLTRLTESAQRTNTELARASAIIARFNQRLPPPKTIRRIADGPSSRILKTVRQRSKRQTNSRRRQVQIFRCEPCKKTFPSLTHLNAHKTTRPHEFKVFYKGDYCNVCRLDLHSPEDFKRHLAGRRHKLVVSRK